MKTEAGGCGFQHLPRDLANVYAFKNHVRSLFCMKIEIICYISRYFLHYILFRLFTDVSRTISTEYARSRAGHLHISWRQQFCGPGTDILKVAQPCINSAWIALLIHGFLPVNARLLITCGTAFYAIICICIANDYFFLFFCSNLFDVLPWALRWLWKQKLLSINGKLKETQVLRVRWTLWTKTVACKLKKKNV